MTPTPEGDDASSPAASSLGRETVRSLLVTQGYAVPDDDLDEITVRLNGLVAGLLSYDEHHVEHEEPWNEWPGAPRHD
jgi:hypothetical protein